MNIHHSDENWSICWKFIDVRKGHQCYENPKTVMKNHQIDENSFMLMKFYHGGEKWHIWWNIIDGMKGY